MTIEMISFLSLIAGLMLLNYPRQSSSFVVTTTTCRSYYSKQRHSRKRQRCAITTDNALLSSEEEKDIFDASTANNNRLSVGSKIGSGSYGIVQFLQSSSISCSFVGKRALHQDEITTKKIEEKEKGKNNNNSTTPINNDIDEKKKKEEERSIHKIAKDVSKRCSYYWGVEQHCFTKLSPHPQLPFYLGTTTTTRAPTRPSANNSKDGKKNDDDEWMVFGFVGNTSTTITVDDDGDDDDGDDTTTTPPSLLLRPAPSLQDLMLLDLKESTTKHELQNIASAFGTTSYEDALDAIIPSLLVIQHHIHKHQIVHRDLKPANLLVHDNDLILIDFGSAADLDPSSSSMTTRGGGGQKLISAILKQRVGLENGNRVAVSPMYSAPEIFIDPYDAPFAFDTFSCGLIVCQLLFGYLEVRVDAGFRQQLVMDADCDLNVWLNNELASKLRPAGLDQALDYLIQRPRLWDLLVDMLAKEPRNRPSSRKALKRWHDVKKNFDDDTVDNNGNRSFFSLVVEALETCEIPSVSRPLHFVATFSRSKSLGLILSEKEEEDTEDEEEETDDADNDNDNFLWRESTKDVGTQSGQVFVRGIVPGGQADDLGVFAIGDRLSGIGELPFIDGGFEKAVEMLQDQPRSSKNVRLHFDRTSVRSNEAIGMNPPQANIHIHDRGAWSTTGRRSAQEDTFILHEIHDTRDRSVLMAGVMDGHGGTRASQVVSNDLPGLVANRLVVQDRTRSVCEALEGSWMTTCESYQQMCLNKGECMADYDAIEGKIQAQTGSEDLEAGTTCSLMALDETTSELTVLNCGDSRSVVVSEKGDVKFVTLDHTPQTEEDRLIQGIKDGFDYSLPKCRLSRWSLRVGEYEYAVGRSLEGSFATSKGIVFEPDVSVFTVQPGEILVSATDGLWGVMDTDEVASELQKMRMKINMSAHDAARALCSMAMRKGSSDNVSAVVVYL